MSLWMEMLQAARRAPELLGESTALVQKFLLGQEAAGGGFMDRSGKPDLYYTLFGLAALGVIQPQRVLLSRGALQLRGVAVRAVEFLSSVQPDSLDLVHLGAFTRNRAMLASAGFAPPSAPDEISSITGVLSRYRGQDGGYAGVPGAQFGTAYGAFLALGVFQDLGIPIPEQALVAASVQALQNPDGSWPNQRLVNRKDTSGGTNATAAAVAVCKQAGVPVPASTSHWLLGRYSPQGGFLSGPDAPIPDLLSTATALHALAILGLPLADVREGCLNFIDSLWSNRGGFHGHWGDDHLDCEYAFYGLLALGHLAR